MRLLTPAFAEKLREYRMKLETAGFPAVGVWGARSLHDKRLMAVACLILFLTAVLFFALEPIALKKQNVASRPDNGNKRTIAMAANLDCEPHVFGDENGKPDGCDVELRYASADRAQINMENRSMYGADGERMAYSGEPDWLTGPGCRINDGPAFLFSTGTHKVPSICFGRKDFDMAGTLYDQKLAALKRSDTFSAFLGIYYLEENAAIFPTRAKAVGSIVVGENDGAVDRYSVGRGIPAKRGNRKVRAAGATLPSDSLCMGMKREHTALLAERNRVIDSVIKEGTLKALSNKWQGGSAEYVSWKDVVYVYQTPVLICIAAAFLLCALLSFCFYRQRVRVMQKEYEETSRALEYQRLLTDATKGLYENIYEVDVTHNRADGESMKRYFERLGMPGNTPYDEALKGIAQKQIKEEFIQGYLDVFLPEHVLAAYRGGKTSLVYDFMISNDRFHYYWMRISARIFFWKADQSVHMITYRQNIDAEKRREQQLLKAAEQDPLTGLYNKAATQRRVEDFLSRQMAEGRSHALLVIDVDCFKNVNDTFGHAFGDFILKEFSSAIRANLHTDDIVGRIGGDEFLALVKNVPDEVWLKTTLDGMNRDLCREVAVNDSFCEISASIGVALYLQSGWTYQGLFKKADKALYAVKKGGKNGNRIYMEEIEETEE